jgi:hypothetical protein
MNRWREPGDDEDALDDDEELWREEVVNEAVAGDLQEVGDEWDATDLSDEQLELDDDDFVTDDDDDLDDLDDDGLGLDDRP